MNSEFLGTEDIEIRTNGITETIIGCAYKVGMVLGTGFLEKVYENALVYELKKSGLIVESQKKLVVYYEDIPVGEYVTDILVNSLVLVELKVVKCFDDFHLAQCLNYLRGTNLNVCILINFGTTRVGIKRIVNNF